MKTRRSYRNQDRLFKELFQPKEAPVLTVRSRRCFDCVSYPTHRRNRGYCPTANKVVSGLGENLPCFGGVARNIKEAGLHPATQAVRQPEEPASARA